MAESQGSEQQAGTTPPALTLQQFAQSMFHGERPDNYFKFLSNFSEQELPSVFQQLLRVVGDAIDDRDTTALARFVQQQQVRAYEPTQTPATGRPDLDPVPLASLRKPLREATVALFTSGAIYRDDQDPFYPAHLSYEEAVRDVRSARERFASLRVIPADTPEERLRVGHLAYDIRAAQKDRNVMFPLAHFRELVQQGIIGALAERNYSYHGLTVIPRFRDETSKQWAQMLKDDGVDAVFLTPG